MAEMTRCLDKKHPLYQEDLRNILKLSGIEEIKGKSFLITGASGLIGLCMIDALMLYNSEGAGINIFAVGRSKDKSASRLGEYYKNDLFHFIEQDVRQPLPEDLKVDYIIPLASNTHPVAYSQYPIDTIEINYKGAEYALLKAVECGATVLYPSSVEIYGNAENDEVFDENCTGALNLFNARSCYPESKRVSEALCLSYMVQKGVNVKIARISRAFGPTMLASDSKASSQFIKNAINKDRIILKSAGEQFFSFIYVSDAVSALLFILLHGNSGVPYNVSSEECNIKLKDFARICAAINGGKVEYEMPSNIEAAGFSIATKAILDNSRLINAGWKPKYRIDEAIIRTVSILS